MCTNWFRLNNLVKLKQIICSCDGETKCLPLFYKKEVLKLLELEENTKILQDLKQKLQELGESL